MIIIKPKDKTAVESHFGNIKQHVTFFRVLLILFLSAIIFIFYSFAYVYVEKKLNAFTVFSNAASIPYKFMRGLTASPELLIIDIKHKDFQKLAYKRQNALDKGLLIAGSDDFVSAKIRHNDKTIKAKVRLKGDLLDHLEDYYPNSWGGINGGSWMADSHTTGYDD